MLQVFICVGSSCHLKGSYQIIKLYEELIKKNHFEDKVELKASFCLGECAKGVAVKVEEDFIEDLTLFNAEQKFHDCIVKKVLL